MEVKCDCGELIELTYENKEALDSPYCKVLAACKCGKNYQFEEWGHIKYEKEAIELFERYMKQP